MNRRWSAIIIVVAMLFAAVLSAQSYAPPPAQAPDEATLKAIKAKTEELGKAIEELRKMPRKEHWEGTDSGRYPVDLLPDIEIFHKAAVWIVRHEEWYHKDYPKWTLEALDQGLERARQLREGKQPWRTQVGRVARGYRSEIDGSIQPVSLVVPREWGKDREKRWRVDVVLHGRDSSLTEVKFLHQHNGGQAPADQDFIQVDVYGRGNNAYRWAGEDDALSASGAAAKLARPNRMDFRFLDEKHSGIEEDRPVLRGFSMGGAGAWHLGLHHPTYWCSVSPGAGFTTTHCYIKNLPEKLPPYQEACLHIYDAVDYAENAANVPVVAYGGDKDPQLQAARNIEAKLKPLGIPMTLLIGLDTEHKYHPDSLKEIMRLQGQHAKKERLLDPKVHFVTYTPAYGNCDWVRIFAQEKQYERSEVDAERTDTGCKVRTRNIRRLALRLLPGQDGKDSVELDGQSFVIKLYEPPKRERAGNIGYVSTVAFEKTSTGWSQRKLSEIDKGPLIKNLWTMGPIDHAFMSPNGFLCIRGTGQPWNPAMQQYADADLRRFQAEWNKYFRGDLPVKDDKDVTEDDVKNRHLILFGDPSSNSLIAKALPKLPLTWTKETFTFGGKTFAADANVPVMIYPGAFVDYLYVVLNSGHTFHAADFEGTNALLYPRLGDYAILKPTPTAKDPLAVEVVTAGLFDENWQIPK